MLRLSRSWRVAIAVVLTAPPVVYFVYCVASPPHDVWTPVVPVLWLEFTSIAAANSVICAVAVTLLSWLVYRVLTRYFGSARS